MVDSSYDLSFVHGSKTAGLQMAFFFISISFVNKKKINVSYFL